MKYNIQRQGDVVVLVPEGELDVSNVPELQNAFEKILGEGYTKVVIDLSKVTYMDSSALGVLVNGLKELRKKNGMLKIANLNGNVERIFQLTRLIKFFETYPTTEEAALSLG
ncbi:MAG: STAS domain-containing protein [Calditrichaeota bacterium]|nr:STAS domain-containing protein [Calditrichota bacterium]